MTRGRKPANAAKPPATDSGKAIELLEDDVDNDEDMSGSSDGEDDYDPIVEKYNVFVSDQLKDHMYLLQYPIRNPDEEYHGEYAPLSARMKPKEGNIEVDVPLESNNFSLLRGEKFGGHSQTEHGIKQEVKVLDRQRLSGKAHNKEASYFVGVVRGGKFFLTRVDLKINCIYPLSKQLFSFAQTFISSTRYSEPRKRREPQQMTLRPGSLEQSR